MLSVIQLFFFFFFFDFPVVYDQVWVLMLRAYFPWTVHLNHIELYMDKTALMEMLCNTGCSVCVEVSAGQRLGQPFLLQRTPNHRLHHSRLLPGGPFEELQCTVVGKRSATLSSCY